MSRGVCSMSARGAPNKQVAILESNGARPLLPDPDDLVVVIRAALVQDVAADELPHVEYAVVINAAAWAQDNSTGSGITASADISVDTNVVAVEVLVSVRRRRIVVVLVVAAVA